MTSQRSSRSKKQIIQDIEHSARQPGFLYSLAFLCRRDLFLDPKEATEKNWHECLSYQELGFLSGLMVKQQLQYVYPSKADLKKQISEVDALFRELHGAYIAPMIDSLKSPSLAAAESKQSPSPPSSSPPHGAGDYFAEGIFYAGSGAYDFQYLDMGVKRYEKDAPWIMQHRGFSIETACAIARQLKTLSEKRLQNQTPPQSFTDLCDQLVSLFSFVPAEITGVQLSEIHAFLQAFSLEPGDKNQNLGIYGDFNTFDSCPIVRLANERYFLPVSFTLAQSIYESPFYWMSSDLQYRDISLGNRGRATEKIAYEMMVQVFGSARAFQGVRVVKNKSEAVTDIDILAFVGNKAVVLQAKSKKLTLLSRRGSEDQLRSDFKAAIQDSYDQAIACRHAILNRSHTFLDSTGNELVLEESLDEVYLICVTSDNYPSLIRQVDHFLTRKTGEPPVIAISLFDLDVLTFYLKDPFDFVFYERQRLETVDYYLADNELVLLSQHLMGGLWRNPGHNIELVDASCAQWIDAHFPAARGLQPHTEASEKLINRWNNDRFKALLHQLKESGIPGFTDAVFMLYEMSSDSADTLIDQIEKTKEKTARDGKRHSFSLSVGKVKERGISFVCRPDAQMLSQDMFALGVSKKYQLQANEWLSLGSVSGSANMIDEASFTKQPWKEDPHLERLSNTLKPGPMRRIGKKTGRNDPCTCGSQIKFKKCCGR